MKAALHLAAVLGILAGCATQPKPVAVAPTPATTTVSARSTSALAFDPAVAKDQQPMDLSRDDRGNSAFVGFEDTTTTYFNTYTDDRRSTDQSGGVNRETVSEKVGDIRR